MAFDGRGTSVVVYPWIQVGSRDFDDGGNGSGAFGIFSCVRCPWTCWDFDAFSMRTVRLDRALGLVHDAHDFGFFDVTCRQNRGDGVACPGIEVSGRPGRGRDALGREMGACPCPCPSGGPCPGYGWRTVNEGAEQKKLRDVTMSRDWNGEGLYRRDGEGQKE